MYDESTNTSSRAYFLKLREECARLVRMHPDKCSSYYYPEINILAKEYHDSIMKRSTQEIIEQNGRNAKITSIKEIREKYSKLGLEETKYIVDGYFRKFGWE